MKAKLLVASLMISGVVHATEFKFTGFIKADVINSNAGVGSYGNVYSHVAVTRALNTERFDGNVASEQQEKYNESSATTLQAAQSRFGFMVKHEKTKGVLEFDLIDGETGFGNQTAIQAQEPRLRLAFVDHAVSDNFHVFIGQKWSTAAGIKGIGSFNYIGNGFQAGNTGFLAQEFGIRYKLSNLTTTLALTGKGKNAGNVNQNELGASPGTALDVNYKEKTWFVGLAAHNAELDYEHDDAYVSGDNAGAFLGKVYASATFGSFKVFGETYTGYNVNNLNSLGIAAGSSLSDGAVTKTTRESGYWLSTKYQLSKTHSFALGTGRAQVDDNKDLLSLDHLHTNQYTFLNHSNQISDKLKCFVQYTNHVSSYGEDEDVYVASVLQGGMHLNF